VTTAVKLPLCPKQDSAAHVPSVKLIQKVEIGRKERMKITYENKSFRKETLEIIDKANEIIEDYLQQGFSLTLRQIYYQFVARDLVPNTERSYKRLGSIINDARMAGLIDWDAIEDRTRNLVGLSSWTSPQQMVRQASEQFKTDWWEGQEYRPEVWIEKEALVGVIEAVCDEYDVPYFACRGYVSQSEMWRAGQRNGRYSGDGQIPVIIHLGDHDPSGIDMTRDNASRLGLFGETDIEVRRIALNMVQIEQYKPPPNPAKMTDSRFDSYMNKLDRKSVV